MKKFILRIFFSELWTPPEKQTLREKITKHFQHKNIEPIFIIGAEDADIAVFKSITEKVSSEKGTFFALPCIYLMRSPHENPEEWVPSSFMKIPRSIELVGLGIRLERMRSKK